MVKSLRYDQEDCDNFSDIVAVNCLRRIRHTHADPNLNGHSAPNGHTASHGDANARVDLPATESIGKVGAARTV